MSIKHSHITVTKMFFLIVSFLILLLFWRIVEPFVIVLVTAGIAAIILSPIDDIIRKKIKHPKISALMMVVAAFIIFFVPLFVATVIMFNQASDIIQSSVGEDGWLENFDITNNPLVLSLPEIVQKEIANIEMAELGRSAAKWVFDNVGNIFSSTASMIFKIFLFFISLYYFLSDKEKLYKEMLKISPFKDRLDTDIMKRITNTVRGVIFGALIVALVQGILATIGMTIFGVPGALLWGALVIIAAQVPLVGTGLVLIPAVAYLFVTGSSGAAIGLLIWSIVFVGLIDNLLAPTLIGGKTRMHAFLILISILGGLQLFGPVGIIIGPTILASVMVVLDLYLSGILEQ